MKKLLKSKRFIFWSVGAVALVIVVSVILSGNGAPVYETETAQRGSLVQEVSITGKVKPAQSVDLQFQNSGRVAFINYKSGDTVKSGAVIAVLDNQDLQATVIEKEAGVLSAQADLNKTLADFSAASDPNKSSALKTEFENAKVNLEQVTKKALADLASDYQNALNSLTEAISDFDSASIVLRNIYQTSLQGKYAYDQVESLRISAANQISTLRLTYSFIDQPYATLTVSIYPQVGEALKSATSAGQTMFSALSTLQNEVQSNPGLLSSTDRTSLNTESGSVSSQLSALLSAMQNILDQNITNDKNISDAKANLATAQAAFPTQEDVIRKQAALKQAEASLLSARSQLRKSIIIAPFDGVIARLDGETGQTVSSTTAIVSFISTAGYQVETNITEVDISKVALGNQAELTLDAYGGEVVFKAKVSSIDPGETIIEGVTTYKTVLDFEGITQEMIRPNMTANISIETNRKEGIITIPQRAVTNRDGQKYVKIENGEILEERLVSLGIVGKDGRVEVTNGIIEGEKVVTFISQ